MPLQSTASLTLDSVSTDTWTMLANRRVFFGHQSVGENVASGLTALLAEKPEIPIRLVREKPMGEVQGGALIFKHVGENGDAVGKVSAFTKIVEEAAAAPGDIVMQKLCYADFARDTDPDSVFAAYAEGIEALRQARPDVQIVHVTAPLLEDRLFPRDIPRRLLGRTTLRDRLAKVQAFNARLREHYGSRDPIFDLAAIESGAASRQGGEALHPAYATRDGGHLNAAGQRVAATELLLFLTGLAAGTP